MPKLAGGPLILLSPAKTLNFDSPLSHVLTAAKATAPAFMAQSRRLTAAASALSKPELKSLMSLSDSLVTLNHARRARFRTSAIAP